MCKYLLPSVLILNVFLTTAALASENSLCCANKSILIKEDEYESLNSHQFCWDPVTNLTSPVKLACPLYDALKYSVINFDIENNQLIFKLPNRIEEVDFGSFCVGNMTNTILNYNVTGLEYVTLTCYGEMKNIEEEIYAYCAIVSCILLLLTALIYILLPELRDLQGKSIINFSLSLGIGLGIVSIMKLMAYEDMDLCAVRGFLAYFFCIASFFWTNAISIQILLSMSRPSVSIYGWRQFIYYAIYAWSCPTILTIAMAIVNFMPGEHLKPGIGLMHCWFFNYKQTWLYMYSVMSILIAVNMCIFIYTSFLLWRLKFSSSHKKALKYKFCMTVRMFIVTGIAWIFEMIPSTVKSHIIWEILDLANSLQGVLIFLVLVVFRPRVIKMMRRHDWLDCVSGYVDRWLAKEDDEEDIAPHTLAFSMEEQQMKS